MLDMSEQSQDDLQAYMKEGNLKSHMLLEGHKVAQRFGVMGTPTTIWIDRQGKVAHIEVGFGGAKQLEAITKRIMK